MISVPHSRQQLQNTNAKYQPQITALTSQEHALEQQLATFTTPGVVANDPIYRSDIATARRLEAKAQKAEAAALCELDGRCGSGHIGAGPIYQQDRRMPNDCGLSSGTRRRLVM
jgi:hypothetical protein